MTHDIATLPKWAQELLAAKERTIADKEEEMKNLRRTHAVLFEYEGWSIIHGPPAGSVAPDGVYRLYFLSHDGAHPACSLKTGDMLLFGRKRRN